MDYAKYDALYGHMSSKELMQHLQKKNTEEAKRAKQEGRLVCWSTSITQQELMETFDICTVYPENHAAATAARKQSQKYLDAAEGAGYSIDNCSYARIGLCYTELLEEMEERELPAPDLVMCSSNICYTIVKWFENVAHKLGVPMIYIDMPFAYERQPKDSNIQYVAEQVRESIIPRLEEITGKKFDKEKFRRICETSNEVVKWWKAACEVNRAVPAPMCGFDMFNYMALVVCARGQEEGAYLFRKWYFELKEKVEKGIGPWPDQEEKYRIIWDGIACWPNLSFTYKLLKKYGVNLVASTYPNGWYIQYEPGSMESFAEGYYHPYFVRSLDEGVDRLKRLVEDCGADGIIYHSNRSCKIMDFRQYETQRQIEKLTGVPSVMFDGDQGDPRVFSEAQFETRLQALIEMMEARKAQKEGL